MTQVKLAYVGDGNFKFIVPMDAELPPSKSAQADAESKVDEVDASDNDTQSDVVELVDAGLLPDNAVIQPTEKPSETEADDSNSSTKTMDDSHANDFLDEDIDADNPNDDSTSSDTEKHDMDIDKPTDNNDSSEQDQQHINNQNDDNMSLDTGASDKQEDSVKKTVNIDIDQGYVSDDSDSDVVLMGVSVPDKPAPSISGKVYRSRSYKCYICGFTAVMQVTFVEHFTKSHPGQTLSLQFLSISISNL